uniref:BEN domain containing 7 n=1 Tax=Amphiprion percula TaxID=161767 RepID=A0A3P8S3S4_AMPPE
MEFGERKRRRKSQSFKLVTDEGRLLDECKTLQDALWLGDEGMEIKKQITGMMRLLSDKTGRVYQRVAAEQDGSTKEPQDRHLNWAHQPGLSSVMSEDHQSNSWNSAGEPGPSPPPVSTSIPNGPGCGQYSTRSRALRILNNTKDLIKVNEANAPCCMCNCKGTLQAILQELRAMRRLMQTQKASLERQEQTASPCQPRLGPGPTPRRRPRKRRPIYKVAPVAVTSTRRAALSPLKASPLQAAPAESGKREECEKDSSPPNIHPISSDSEVRLAEDYDVFISKAQLDSILVNYTRSGSLLFRKLVCAFFDDATLANSLPNGKRKRGLNDNRQGLDQNIVGAIKVFTEKYCTEHRIEKLPGPRDWVQILQDQIKLARRRASCDEKLWVQLEGKQ